MAELPQGPLARPAATPTSTAAWPYYNRKDEGDDERALVRILDGCCLCARVGVALTPPAAINATE